MDGDIAPLDEISKLADEYDSMVYVDDCHGEGVLGEKGAGIVDHFNLQGKVDFEVGSFSKALGVQGGILAGSEEVRNHALMMKIPMLMLPLLLQNQNLQHIQNQNLLHHRFHWFHRRNGRCSMEQPTCSWAPNIETPCVHNSPRSMPNSNRLHSELQASGVKFF